MSRRTLTILVIVLIVLVVLILGLLIFGVGTETGSSGGRRPLP